MLLHSMLGESFKLPLFASAGGWGPSRRSFMAETKSETRVPTVPCVVRNQPSGGLSVTFQIDAPTTARLKGRAQSMDLARYIYENILKPAVSTHVY